MYLSFLVKEAFQLKSILNEFLKPTSTDQRG